MGHMSQISEGSRLGFTTLEAVSVLSIVVLATLRTAPVARLEVGIWCGVLEAIPALLHEKA